MKRFVFLGLVASAALVGVISSASAADIARAPAPAPHIAPVYPVSQPYTNNWTGFYAGVDAGYGWGSADASATAPFFGAVGHEHNIRGASFGGVFGYNRQFGNIVAGIEGSVHTGSIGGSGSSSAVAGPITLNVHQSASLDWTASIDGRVGYAFGNDWLPYAKIGYAMGQANVRGSGSVFGFPIASYDDRKDVSGLEWGVGLEKSFGQHWSAKLEYVHQDFGSFKTNADVIGGGTLAVKHDLDNNVIRAGLNYRF